MKRDPNKAAAHAAGLKIYQGNPCLHGHPGLRTTRGGKCVDCELEYSTSPARRANQNRYYQRHRAKQRGPATLTSE